MPQFLIRISEDEATLLNEWNGYMGFKWTLKQCVQSALDRGLMGIELETADYRDSEELREREEEASDDDETHEV